MVESGSATCSDLTSPPKPHRGVQLRHLLNLTSRRHATRWILSQPYVRIWPFNRAHGGIWMRHRATRQNLTPPPGQVAESDSNTEPDGIIWFHHWAGRRKLTYFTTRPQDRIYSNSPDKPHGGIGLRHWARQRNLILPLGHTAESNSTTGSLGGIRLQHGVPCWNPSPSLGHTTGSDSATASGHTVESDSATAPHDEILLPQGATAISDI